MVFFGLFSESGTLGDSCTSMRLRQGVLLSFLYVVFRFAASICYSNASERGSPLPPHGLIALFTESPHGRHDPADGAHQLRLFLSGHIVYVSALSAFYAFIQSIRGLVRFRVLMNALTGGGIWCTMVLPVVFMLLRSRKLIAAQTSSISQHFR